MSAVATINPNAPINIRGGFSSIVEATEENKVRIFNALANSEKLDDHLNESIMLKDILSQTGEMPNRVSGEMEEVTFITLLDADDSKPALRAGSKGLLNSIQDLVNVFGHPATWDSPREVHAVSVASAKGKFFQIKLGAPTKK